jgi:hypothetical protein
MVVANHVSWLDIFVINSLHPCRFVAKAEIRAWPVLGWLAPRPAPCSSRAATGATCATSSKAWCTPAARRAGGLLPGRDHGPQGRCCRFHANLFEAAIDAKVPVQPYALRYEDPAGRCIRRWIEFIGEMTFAESIVAIIWRRAGQGAGWRSCRPSIPSARTGASWRRRRTTAVAAALHGVAFPRRAGCDTGHALLLAPALVFRALDLQQAAVVQADSGQLAAPHAAAVQARSGSGAAPGPAPTSGRTPRSPGRLPARHLEPRHQADPMVAPCAFLFLEIHHAVGAAQAHARQGVDDAAQPVDPRRAVVPAVRLVAVHLRQELHQAGPRSIAALRRPAPSPAPASIAAARRHAPADGPARGSPAGAGAASRSARRGRARPGSRPACRICARAADAVCHRQQVQVVVAQHGCRPAAAGHGQLAHAAQRGQRIGAAVDQVACKQDAGSATPSLRRVGATG